ncbi:hypothetical protein HY948_03205 [Candidatus Gottesmanbacteria bacterium]|nr:hypothetical protein [Candidatus Gottesmanbacteria bacterium]
MPEGGHDFDIKKEVESFSSYQTRVSTTHPNWSRDQIQREALIVFNTEMFPKQVQSHFSEVDGKQAMDPDQEYDVIGDKLVHKHYGPFDKMIDSAQSEEEKSALRLFQETMVHVPIGTRVQSFDLHAVEGGRHAIRYTDIALKQSDGSVKLTKRLDIAWEGRSMNLDEAWRTLNDFATSEKGEVIVGDRENVGILVVNPEKNIEKQEQTLRVGKVSHDSVERTDDSIHMKNSPLEMKPYNEEKQNDVPEVQLIERINITKQKKSQDIFNDISKDVVKVGSRVVTDTKTTLVGAGLFALEALKKRKKTNESKQVVPLADKIRSVFVHKKEQFDEFRNRRLKEILHHVDHRIRESGKRFAAHVVSRWHEMMAVQSMFAFAAESGVGIGIALLGLRFMTKELPKMPKKQQLEKKLLKGREFKNFEAQKKVKKPKRERAEQRRASGVDKISHMLGFVKKEKKGEKAILPIVDDLKRRFTIKKERYLALKERKDRVIIPVEQLLKTLHLLARRLEQLKKPSGRSVFKENISAHQKSRVAGTDIPKIPFLETGRFSKMHRQESVLQFSFAWAFWVFISAPRLSIPQKNFYVSERNQNKASESTELLAGVEPRSWILLGIIWYLSMIRESGFGNNNSVGQYVGPANPVHQYLRPQGVIFAYTS